jgi:cytosine/adenosine deaminase-related metal-dependent hydrolase
MKYGGVPEEDALKMITLNPAKQLGIDKRTGSIEQGKDADIVIWNTHPFSPYSHPEVTMIEGIAYFERSKDIEMRAEKAKEREALERLDVNRAPGSGGTPPRIPTERIQADRDNADKGDNRK